MAGMLRCPFRWLLGVLLHFGDGASLVFRGRMEPVLEWLESMMVRGF